MGASTYIRTADFSDDEDSNRGGRSTVDTAALDAELDAVLAVTNAHAADLDVLLRDDNKLQDDLIEGHEFSAAALSLLAAYVGVVTFIWRGAWQATTDYAVGDLVYVAGSGTYLCETAHTSGGAFAGANWGLMAADAGASLFPAPGAGDAGKMLRVDAAETAYEFVAQGTGGGIDADTVDGYHAASMLNSNLIPAATVALFYQAAAPTGWTQNVSASVHNKALRVVNTAGGGTGGVTAFTSVFGASKNTGTHVLTTTQIPVHTHGAGTLATDNDTHNHDVTIPRYTGGGVGTDGFPGGDNGVFSVNDVFTTNNDTHNHDVTGSTGAAGGGGGHSHTLSLDLAYIDLIICSKDAY